MGNVLGMSDIDSCRTKRAHCSNAFQEPYRMTAEPGVLYNASASLMKTFNNKTYTSATFVTLFSDNDTKFGKDIGWEFPM